MAYQTIDPNKDFGDIIEAAEWLETCERGNFIDYDGFGYPVRENLIDRSLKLYPSEREKLPEDATHVMWFNR